jgi:thiamine biosynthesis lipoprotein ApbE
MNKFISLFFLLFIADSYCVSELSSAIRSKYYRPGQKPVMAEKIHNVKKELELIEKMYTNKNNKLMRILENTQIAVICLAPLLLLYIYLKK